MRFRSGALQDELENVKGEYQEALTEVEALRERVRARDETIVALAGRTRTRDQTIALFTE